MPRIFATGHEQRRYHILNSGMVTDVYTLTDEEVERLRRPDMIEEREYFDIDTFNRLDQAMREAMYLNSRRFVYEDELMKCCVHCHQPTLNKICQCGQPRDR